MSINPSRPSLYVNVTTVWGGTDIEIDESEAELYIADPDAFVAHTFGLTKTEYLEWLQTSGSPLCSERTKTGRLCRNPIGAGGQLPCLNWKAQHRSKPCRGHEQ